MDDLKKHRNTIILSFLLIVFMSGSSFACDAGTSHTTQTGHAFHTGSENFRQLCSKEDACQKNGEHSDCGEHCKDQCCRCGASSVGGFALFLPEDASLNIGIVSEDKSHFGYLRVDLSLGFFSIWQPPKIS